MPEPTLDNTAAFDSLLRYFGTDASNSIAPIQHPDRNVDRLAQGSDIVLRDAAVLIPVTRRHADHDSEVILTVRSDQLKSHAGQISLPGGTQEPHDEDEVATALRETEEEIGLAADRVEVLGRLGTLALPSGFQITPVIGLIEPNAVYTPCPIEVASIFSIPLQMALDLDAYTKAEMEFNGQPRTILELMFGEYRIWGATAAILHHLARRVADHG